MTPEEFCRWLQGFAELHDGTPSEAQWSSIREHLQTVFCKVTPAVEHEERPAAPHPLFPTPTPEQLDEAAKAMKKVLKKSLAERVHPYTPTSLRRIC